MRSEVLLARINQALSAGTLSPRAQRAGERIVEKLNSPVRIALLGFPGSGKSNVINMLTGERLIPDGFQFPALEIVHSDEPKITVRRADGEMHDLPDSDLASADLTDMVFAQLKSDNPILTRISFLEVSAEGSAEDRAAAVSWAAKRADIALWCTQVFQPEEDDLWAMVPDELKDHSFLLITKADQLSERGLLAEVISSLENVVSSEFAGLFPLATLQGLAARLSDGGIQESNWFASGGAALLAKLLQHVERGRRADLDGALLFLTRNAPELAALPEDEAVEDKPIAAATKQPEAPKPQDEASGTTEAPSGDQNASNILRQSSELLRNCGAELQQSIGADGEIDPDHVLDRCSQTLEQVSDLMLADDPDAAEFAVLGEDIASATDSVTLLSLEREPAAAVEAVTLLLQIRRGIDAQLAA